MVWNFLHRQADGGAFPVLNLVFKEGNGDLFQLFADLKCHLPHDGLIVRPRIGVAVDGA